MKKTADAVVIGGGVNGCSTAYHLAKAGVKRVVLLERNYIAGGPTGRSSGVVRQHYTIETLARMARYSVGVFQHFEEIFGGSAGFVQTGAVFIAAQDAAEELRKTVAMHQRVGIKTSVLSPEELQQMEPELAIDNLACGAYEPDSGYADPALTANSICAAARSLGVDVIQRSQVEGLEIVQREIRGVRTQQGVIETPVVVNIAGPWGSEIAAIAGVEIPITPSRHPVVILRRPGRWRNPTPVWVDLIDGAYYKPEGESKIMVGSLKPEEGFVRVDTESYRENVDYDEISVFSESIAKRFPVMREGLAQGGWAGLYDVTPDWQPVMDKVAAVKGFFCAVGFSGHGFKLSPAVGKIMAELVTTGHSSSFDASPFRFARFKEGQLSQGAYQQGIIG